jgi:hypothetical protein
VTLSRPTRIPWHLLFSVLILLGAAGLYLFQVGAVSVWEDESWMAIALRGNLPEVWQFASAQGLHPPLYFVLGWGWVRLVGESELALRWLAGVYALIGLAFTYRLGASVGGRRVGVYALLLVAGSLFLLYFARLARQYTLFFALAPALAWCYWQWMTAVQAQRPAMKWLLGVVVCQVALLYTHYFGAWMLVVLGLHAVLTVPLRLAWRIVTALAISALLFLPWVPAILSQFTGRGTGIAYSNPDIEINLRGYLDRIFNGSHVLGWLLIALGIYALMRRVDRRLNPLLGIWLILPLGMSLIINTRFLWFLDRNMLFTLPAVAVLMAYGLAYPFTDDSQGRLPAVLRPLLRWRWILALLFVAFGVLNYQTYWPFVTPQWRILGDSIRAEARPADTFVLDAEPYSLAYYLERGWQQPVSIQGIPSSRPHTVTLTRAADWVSNPAPPVDRVWLIAADGSIDEANREHLPAGMQRTREIALGVMIAELYQREPTTVTTTFGTEIALGLGAEVPPLVSGQPLNLDVWWRSVDAPQTDYSVSVFVRDAAGAVLAQQDGGFDQGRVQALLLPNDRWIPDARTLAIPALAPGSYELGVAVYDWRDGRRLAPTNGTPDQAFILAQWEIGG